MQSKTDFELWKKCIELANKFREAEPWEYFSEDDMIAVYLNGYDLFFSCSIIGSDTNQYGLTIHPYFKDMIRIYDRPYLKPPSKNFVKYRDNLDFYSLYFTKRGLLSFEQYYVITDLGYDFGYTDNWPNFRIHYSYTAEPTIPYDFTLNEIAVSLEQVLEVVYQVKEGKVQIPEEPRYNLARYLVNDEDFSAWYTRIEKFISDDMSFDVEILPKHEILSRIDDVPFNDKLVEIDLNNVDSDFKIINEDTEEKLQLLTVVDSDSKSIIYFHILYPNDSLSQELKRFFLDTYVFEHGKMKKVLVRNDKMWGECSELFGNTGIILERGDLIATDDLLTGFGFKNKIQ